ncbi:MAG: diguanylate cyclase [Spirochaetes bacterium]|nr:diguanylate cyclase [Spirochaetota bacterium]
MQRDTKIFIILSISFFISFFIYFSLGVKAIYSNTYTKNEKKFSELKLRILSTYLITSDLKTNYFSTRMQELLNTSEMLIAFSFRDKSGNVRYLVTKNRSIIESDKISPRIADAQNLFLYELFTAPVSLSATNKYIIRAVYFKYDYNDIYALIKDSFFILIAFLIVTFIYLLYVITYRDLTVKQPVSRPDYESKMHSIYSPFSGLIWKDQLLPALDRELKKACKSGKNLTLAFIEIDNFLEFSDRETIYTETVKYVKELFDNKDLLFEWYSGYAVILSGYDITNTILKIDHFRKTVSNKITGSKNITFSAGLSARNNRDIDAAILYKEAKTALRKAGSEGGNQVIAFNADPVKYRKFRTAEDRLSGKQKPVR